MVENASIATPRIKRKLPPRSEMMQVLQSGEEYDVLVIGGGATGAGVALDSITRGTSGWLAVLVNGDRIERVGRRRSLARVRYVTPDCTAEIARIRCYF